MKSTFKTVSETVLFDTEEPFDKLETKNQHFTKNGQNMSKILLNNISSVICS